MTREEAVSLLRRYRRNRREKGHRPGSYGFVYESYEQTMVRELIDRISRSNLSPIEVVSGVYSAMDAVLGESEDDHFITHRFAAMMEHIAGDILQMLREQEEKNAQN